MEQLDSYLLNSLNSQLKSCMFEKYPKCSWNWTFYPLFAVSRGKTILERVESAHIFKLSPAFLQPFSHGNSAGNF